MSRAHAERAAHAVSGFLLSLRPLLLACHLRLVHQLRSRLGKRLRLRLGRRGRSSRFSGLLRSVRDWPDIQLRTIRQQLLQQVLTKRHDIGVTTASRRFGHCSIQVNRPGVNLQAGFCEFIGSRPLLQLECFIHQDFLADYELMRTAVCGHQPAQLAELERSQLLAIESVPRIQADGLGKRENPTIPIIFCNRL